MNELAKFLLARIAEDEGTGFAPARDLAECEAKRRIVERSLDEASLYRYVFETIRPHDDDDYTSGALWGLDYALRALAVPYASHPDYREEWKP